MAELGFERKSYLTPSRLSVKLRLQIVPLGPSFSWLAAAEVKNGVPNACTPFSFVSDGCPGGGLLLSGL